MKAPDFLVFLTWRFLEDWRRVTCGERCMRSLDRLGNNNHNVESLFTYAAS